MQSQRPFTDWQAGKADRERVYSALAGAGIKAQEMPVHLKGNVIYYSIINSSRSSKCIAEGVLRSFVSVVEGVVERNH